MPSDIIAIIQNQLKNQNKALSISEIAKKANISRFTAARYLELLHFSGQVKRFEVGKAKKYMLTSELNLCSLSDLTSDLIIVLNSEFKIIYINDAYLNFSHLSKNMVIGRRIDALNLDVFSNLNILDLLQNCQVGEVKNYILEINRNNCKYFYELTFIKVIITFFKTTISIVVEDITEKKRIDEELKFLATIVFCSEDAIIGVDKTFFIKSWNVRAERLFGYTAKEVIGLPISVLCPPKSNDFSNVFTRVISGESIHRQKCRRRCKDGSIVDMSQIITPVYSQSGEIVGSSIIYRDIKNKPKSRKLLDI